MNNSSDFMNYLHEDKIQRLRNDVHAGPRMHQSRLAGDMVESPFGRVRSAISTWIAGARNHDTHQS